MYNLKQSDQTVRHVLEKLQTNLITQIIIGLTEWEKAEKITEISLKFWINN